ncbi:MAG TPA: S49 family peptidase [Planctomycetota bacterium]|nr:S49 family peptidase [Planctomycetota bacterium]HRR79608.1 S49 family peptidase [Planctomycetota bacterium]HRT94682.1 S49 family peptidase [Planctomycetota bacterium]
MPDWNELLNELKAAGGVHDLIRRKYLRLLSDLTGRNVILYYSGWLQKRNLDGVEVNDADKNGLMTVVHQLDRSRGLDLLLHTPGGETAATESLVDYLRAMFGSDIRAFVPQLALSAGTMIACACREIWMGKQSSLGPIDPQFRGIPAHGVLEEFERAREEIGKDPSKIPIWQPILAKYPPAFIGECEKAMKWAKEMVSDWLMGGMFSGRTTVKKRKMADGIVRDLTDHALSKSHARHLSYDRCKKIGLRVRRLEDNQELQDAVLSVHHACIHTLGATPAIKIIENHLGRAFIQIAHQVVVQGPAQ